MVIGIPEGTPAVDSGLGQVARGLTREGLIQLSADGRTEPRLLRSWRWEDSGLTFRATLQDGVTFHDGQPLTAATVVDALTTAVRRENYRALYPSFNSIESISAADDHTVLITLSSPSMFLPEDLEIPIERGTPSQGTGPFRVVSSSRSEIVLEPFEKYRGGRPNVDVAKVVVRPIPTLRTAWTNVLRGDLDMVTDVPPDAVEFISNDDVQVLSFARRYQYLLVLNEHRPDLRSPLVRRALNLALDRGGIVSRVLKGRGTPSTGPLWPKYWAYDQSIPGYGYDPRAAEDLLDQAGYHRGSAPATADRPPARLRFTCIVPANFTLWERLALEVQRSLYAIGVDMQFRVVPFEQFDTLLREGSSDAAFIDMISGPTPGRAYIFWRSEKKTRGLNVFGYENEEAERLFDILRTSANEASTRAATARLQRVFLDDPPALFIAWNERSRAIRRVFSIPDEPDKDALMSLWRWGARPTPQLASAP